MREPPGDEGGGGLEGRVQASAEDPVQDLRDSLARTHSYPYPCRGLDRLWTFKAEGAAFAQPLVVPLAPDSNGSLIVATLANNVYSLNLLTGGQTPASIHSKDLDTSALESRRKAIPSWPIPADPLGGPLLRNPCIQTTYQACRTLSDWPLDPGQGRVPLRGNDREEKADMWVGWAVGIPGYA